MKQRGAVKYRKSIIKSMDEKFVKKYGFEESYRRFERSINMMDKEGDLAEELAIQHLKDNNQLSDNYRTNAVIALNTIKIEADIIDYDNRIIYETKSRRNGELAKKAVKQKWNVFQYDKDGSIYQNYEFKGIVVANYEAGPTVKGVATFDASKFDRKRLEESFLKHYEKVELLRSVKRSKGYDETGNRINFRPRKFNDYKGNNGKSK